MEKRTIDGKTYDVYTFADWQKDKVLKIKVGQLIEPAIYWDLLCALPPKSNGHVFQVGEPFSHDWNSGTALYQTFEDMGGNYYLYIGLRG